MLNLALRRRFAAVFSLDRSVYGHMITKFSGMGRLPHFPSYGAPPTRALRARVELRYYEPFCNEPLLYPTTNEVLYSSCRR